MLFFFVIATVLVSSTFGSKCPDGYRYFGGDDTCVRAGHGKSYQQAKAFCQADGGDLVRITSMAKTSLVYELVGNDDNIWMGVEDIAVEGSFTYTDGSALGFTNWRMGEPNNYNNEDCVHLWGRNIHRNEWNDNNCAQPYSFACDVEPRELGCSDGWEHNEDEDVCIMVVNSVKDSFEGARAHCKQEGGDLVTKLNNKLQKDFVKDMLTKRVYYWVGISSPQENGDYQFVNGDALSFSAFRRGQPTNRKKHACIEMKNGKWYNRRCGKKRNFVCQKDLHY